MKKPHELIIEMFQRSVFGLTFETEDILGYRSQSNVLRALSVDLKQQTVEYELTPKGLPTKRRVEYSPTLTELIKKLPVTADAFDMKFEGLKISDSGVSVAERKGRSPFSAAEDPWDMTNYFDKPGAEKSQGKTVLKIADKDSK